VGSTLDVLLQTFTIMGNRVSHYELAQADIVLRPAISGIKGTDFSARNLAILEGERAALEVIGDLKNRLVLAAR